MEQYEFLALVARALESLGVRYFVTGSMASMAYGEPRLTNDIDIVADLGPGHVAGLLKLFPGPEFYLSEEAVKGALRGRKQFNIIHPSSGFKADIIIPKQNDFDAARFARVKRLRSSESAEANFSSPEDVIVKKLDFYREGGSDKHLRDIAGMIKISGAMLDTAYIASWAAKLGLTEIWERVQQEARPGR
jgi:hypothetical protein